jgi:radical SAM superfamily enzyme YgiQ (UPF0313 family)
MESSSAPEPALFSAPVVRLRMAVAVPSSAREGLASLALHGLLALAARAGAEAEPVFSPGRPAGRPCGHLSGRALGDFELVAFSVAYEEQWPLLPDWLARAGVPPRARDRDHRHPLVILGGVAARLNPRPVLPFVDALIPGDAEPALPALLGRLAALRGAGREELLEALAALPGVATQPFGSGPVRALFALPGRPVVERLPRPGSLFDELLLVETGRGCPGGCRFCALGFSRRPAGFFEPEAIRAAVEEAGPAGRRVGLVGASLGRHPRLIELVSTLAELGVDLSPASLDPGALAGPEGPRLAGWLAGGGQRSMTLAPEAGSERLRRVLNKPFTDEMLEAAVRRLGEAGLVHLKLYLMIGLPTETDGDLEAAAELVLRVRGWLARAHRGRGGTGRVALSLNPFVPKPHTPFAREAMPEAGELIRRRRLVAAGLRRAGGGIELSGIAPRQALLQAWLARADERAADLLLACQGAWPPPAELARAHGAAATRRGLPALPADSPVPWSLVDVGLRADFLEAERASALEERTTPTCPPDGCRLCGACGPRP